jgi:DNA processing protein
MSSDVNNTINWLGLSSIRGVGRTTFRKLVAAFGSPGAVLAASADALREQGDVSQKIAHEITSARWQIAAEEELERAQKAGVAIVTQEEEAYPAALREIPDAPLFLYILGSLRPEDAAAIAIVGTRTATHSGLTLTHRMAYELASAGRSVVSGMARGIDTQAHKGALAAQGRTIAVLGCGIDRTYPPENRDLMKRIAETGAVVTENPFGTPPDGGNFPARNRIISGLAAGTVIVEAAADSGSLITADYTIKQDRALFAVPGTVGAPLSRGTNTLIKQGAVLVETAADVLAHLGSARVLPSKPAERPLPPLSGDETAVLGSLSTEPTHIDSILAACTGSPGTLSGILTALELKGLVSQLPGKYFVLN